MHEFVKVKSVKYLGKQNVYNMEVETHHNYAVNGGMIIHNCIDALRYSLEEFNNGKRSSVNIMHNPF